MNPKILFDMLRKRPFVPFRITLSTGQTYLVSHPESAVIDRSTFYLGVPGPKGLDEPFEDFIWISLIHIVSAEPTDGRSRPKKRPA
jgi:hypothetical protein